ncbi:MAG: hypothetical protein ACUVWR_04180 [Anaerolineae bacterium]
MSKKRPRKQSRQRPTVKPVQAAAPIPPVARGEGSSRPSATTSLQALAQTAKPTAPDLRAEYRYVIADLKRIGIVAASMFALLVVLAFILT